MSVYKRYGGKKVTSRDPNYDKARWYVWKRVKGHPVIHQAIPEARTKEQAELAEKKLIDNLFNEAYGERKPIGFTEFVDTVYLKHARQKNPTIYVIEIFCTELKKFFGNRKITTITPQDCRDYQHQRLNTPTKYKKPRSPSSVNKEMTTLTRIFNLAIEEKKLSESPMRFVQKLKEPKPRRRLLTDDQKKALWAELEKDDYLMRFVLLATNLPLRKGQILAITAPAIDFQGNTLLAVASKGKEPRKVPINATAKAVLTEMVERNQFFDVKIFQKRWQKMLVAAGINKKDGTREENYHVHDLRVWFGSELIRLGVNPYYVKDLFGHSSMEVSAIYIEPEMSDLTDAVRKLDKGKKKQKRT